MTWGTLPDLPNQVVVSALTRRNKRISVRDVKLDLSDLKRRLTKKRSEFRGDGKVFVNHCFSLPPQKIGYYCEWVVPYVGMLNTGGARIVIGKHGEVFLNTHHYDTKKWFRLRADGTFRHWVPYCIVNANLIRTKFVYM